MKCRLPMRIGGGTGGGATPSEYVISVTGEGNNTYCYLNINETKVTSAGTYAVSAGSSIECFVAPSSSKYEAQVLINGAIVVSTQDGATYTYTPTTNASIVLTYSRTSKSEIAITEE